MTEARERFRLRRRIDRACLALSVDQLLLLARWAEWLARPMGGLP